MRIFLIIAALLVSGQAFAGTCPLMVNEVDEALSSSTAAADVLQQAEALRDEGEALHASGDHEGSVAKLTEAKALLGI